MEPRCSSEESIVAEGGSGVVLDADSAAAFRCVLPLPFFFDEAFFLFGGISTDVVRCVEINGLIRTIPRPPEGTTRRRSVENGKWKMRLRSFRRRAAFASTSCAAEKIRATFDGQWRGRGQRAGKITPKTRDRCLLHFRGRRASKISASSPQRRIFYQAHIMC